MCLPSWALGPWDAEVSWTRPLLLPGCMGFLLKGFQAVNNDACMQTTKGFRTYNRRASKRLGGAAHVRIAVTIPSPS